MSVHQHCRGNLQCWINDSSLKGFINHWDLRAVLGPALVLSDLSILAIFILCTCSCFALFGVFTCWQRKKNTKWQIKKSTGQISGFLNFCVPSHLRSPPWQDSVCSVRWKRVKTCFSIAEAPRDSINGALLTPSQPGHHIYPQASPNDAFFHSNPKSTSILYSIHSTSANALEQGDAVCKLTWLEKSGIDKLSGFCAWRK